MNEYLIGLGITIITLLLTYIFINKVIPYFKNYIMPKSSSLIFSSCVSVLSTAGDGDDGNSEEQFKQVLNHLSLSADSEVVIFEED